MSRPLPLQILLTLAIPLASGIALAPRAGADPAEQTAEAPSEAPDFPEQAEAAGCDSTAGGEVDVEELIEDQPVDVTLPTPTPTRWRTARGRQCSRYHGRLSCNGPRRVPEPFGPAEALAADLGLDDEDRAGRIALNGAPDERWLAAIDGEVGPGLLWPVPDGRQWRGFGQHAELVRGRRGRIRHGRRRRLHQGVDIGAPAGTLIRAVNDGLVLYSFNGMRGYGNAVVLLHADGTVSLYAHCQATRVFRGQRVRRGQVVGEVGHTGLAHGDHLHFEWRRNGRPRNPSPHFVGRPDAP